jgi:methyltransferase (TIGR00027 family)
VNPSRIAAANAMFRWAESRRGPDRILDDPWAGELMESSARLEAIRYSRFAIPPLARTIDELVTAHCVRHRSIDELVCRAIEHDGYEQVVIVAAGYDMRASRFANLGDGVRWFELDHPATQNHKVLRLAGVRDVNRDVVRAPIDLMTQDLGEVARAAGVDPRKKTCFVAEGIIHYLSHDRFETLLAAVGGMSAPARLVFSFITPDMVSRLTPTLANLFRLVREIPQLHFRPAELEKICGVHGLVDFKDWSFAAQSAEFVRAGARRHAKLTQNVAQVQLDAPAAARAEPSDRELVGGALECEAA